jgi:hypothetical protein
MPYRINLYGGPGVGKSALAAWLYANLIRVDCEVELVNEWIKSWAWQNIKPQGCDQIYVLAKQLRREEIVLRQGVSIITDSPLALQLAYASIDFPDIHYALSLLVKHFDLTYNNNIDVFIQRDENIPYKQSGRYHNLADAIKMDKIIKHQIAGKDIVTLNGPEMNKNILFDIIKQKITSKTNA